MILVVPKILKIVAGKRVKAMAIFPIILVRDIAVKESEATMNHERIHFRQQIELLILLFYLLYGGFYLYYRLRGYTHFNAYMSIPFEKEAYANESDLEYLKHRRIWVWAKYILNK